MRSAGRRVASLVAVVFGVAAGCADSTFRPDAEDARRLDLLHGDGLSTFLATSATCEDDPAHYRPSTGEPLDFAAVEGGLVRCTRRPASAEEVLGVLAAAEAAGWTPSVEGGPGGNLRFRKRFGDVWSSATVSASSLGFGVELSMPPHTSTGDPPTAKDTARGRACVDAVRARRSPMPDCALLVS